MYDYLEEHQVKVFYTPIFVSNEQTIDKKDDTWHSGGSLIYFGVGDKLPLKTMYYKYPKDFLIYDYRGYDEVFIIKDGALMEIKNFNEILESDLGVLVVDNYGRHLNIEKPIDLIDIRAEFEKTVKTNNELNKKYFPNGLSIEVVQESDFKERNEIVTEKRDKLWGDFMFKWYKEIPNKKERQLGELLHCYMFLKDNIERFKDDDRTLGDYNKCKKAIIEFVKENKGITDRYFNWVEVEEIQRERLREELENIKREG